VAALGSGVMPLLAEAQALSRRYSAVPVTLTFHCDTETPVSAFLKLRGSGCAFLLESAEQDRRLGRYSFLGVDPREVLRLQGETVNIVNGDGEITFDISDSLSDPFDLVADRVWRREVSPMPAHLGNLPFQGGAVGYFGFDLVRHVERLPQPPPDDLDLPDAAFLIADVLVVFDHMEHTISLVTHIFPEEGDTAVAYMGAVGRLQRTRERLVCSASPPNAFRAERGDRETEERDGQGEQGASVAPPGSNLSRQEFVSAVERVKDYIHAGEVFQTVLSQRFERDLGVEGFSVYRALRAVNPSPYMYYISFGDFEVVGSSPEPLVKVQGDRVETRPIAGTRPRGRNPEEDSALAQELLADEKERAEHLMLVDLGRNDLGRVCRAGTIKVSEFMAVERYSHVMHMVSGITGQIRDEYGASDVLRATFPAGTVSGAPKIRAVEIIYELEPSRRGPYAGVVGYLDLAGGLDSCLFIRTFVIKSGTAYVQAGAGIVADSDPQREYEETERKALALFCALERAVQQEEERSRV